MSAATGRVAVVVLNWNGAPWTDPCVASLKAAGVPPRDILLVDNGSTDDSVARLKAAHPDVPLLETGSNLGYAGGNNTGIARILEEGRHEHVLVLNNDTLVPPGLLDRLVAAMDADARIGIAQPRVVCFDGTTLDNAGFEMDRHGVTVARGREGDPSRAFDEEGFFYPSGACMLARAAMLRQIGLFDATMFMYNEDVDLGWRARLAGWRVVLVDGARCLHAESTTAGISPRKMGVIWRNRIRTLVKNYGTARLLLRVPAALFLTGAFAMGSAFLQRRWVFVPLYLRALLWNAAHLGDTLRARRRVQALRRVGDQEVERFMARDLVEVRMLRARLKRASSRPRPEGDGPPRG